MDQKAKNLVKNFSYSLSSNFLSLIISSLVILFIPKIFGVEEYGYWQLYIFYSTFLGFLQIGWNDGIYLRYGGEDYKSLDKKMFFSQFYMLIIFQIFLAAVIFILSTLLVENLNRVFIGQMLAANLVLINSKFFLSYILQGSNKIKEYSQIVVLDRVTYLLLILFLILVGMQNFKFLILADILSKLASLIFSMYLCREIVFNNIRHFYINLHETFENISVGMKLMISNISALLIVGIVKLGIEKNWSIEVFGQVSLTLSVSSLILVFINGMGIVLFPILRRAEEKDLIKIYYLVNELLMFIFLGILLFYYPIKLLLNLWLPHYSDGLIFMAFLLPVCIFEGKMALLFNTYLKTLRLEKLLLKVNLFTVCISLILTYISTIILENLYFSVLNIMLLLYLRNLLAEVLLTRFLKISFLKNFLLETIMIGVFVITSWFYDSWLSFYIYGVVYILFIVYKKSDFINIINQSNIFFGKRTLN